MWERSETDYTGKVRGGRSKVTIIMILSRTIYLNSYRSLNKMLKGECYLYLVSAYSVPGDLFRAMSFNCSITL